ncbi:hypothetical protein BV22DRAFT_1053839 [Leucogyrophana mollusca]|uniref:Uncharacterized protein n=1 Tax=Leucogyrophana mollusca TaxID=85980 RepID=A0ACB8BYR7_9AGAM|nr:hypothetical protein BV22DRAFT_1053839 [Leucogyrophana mollusca]
MSTHLLRQCAASSRLSCSSCLRSRHPRFYTSQSALAVATQASTGSTHSDAPVAGPSTISLLGHDNPGPPADFPKASGSKNAGKETKTSFRNPLEPTRVDLYLASIRAAGLEPTLDDIERCRPPNHAPPDSPRYADEYHNLVDTLCRSFSKEQLRHFGELYKMDPIWTRTSRRKVEYAESIVEKQWEWPSLKEIERKRRDRTEVTVKTFSVNPSQLFLILGKDGADLLQLSMQYNVHISLVANPLALRVEGFRGALKELTEHMSALKKGIIEEIVELPTKRPIRQDLVQRISRLAGAYVENLGFKGKIRICAKDPMNLTTAKRLATRASSEVEGFSASSFLCYVPSDVKNESPVPISMFPHTYSIYPFLSPRSLPWTMTANGAFRIRRVAEWLGVDAYEDIRKTGGLAGGRGRMLDKAQAPQHLFEMLFKDLPDQAPGFHRVVTASLGHMLLSSATPTQRPSIFPPLKGYWTLSKILKWLQGSDMQSTFVPSLPTPILNSPPTKQTILHRLLYKTLPRMDDSDGASNLQRRNVQTLVKFEVELTQSSTDMMATTDHVDDRVQGIDQNEWPDSPEIGVPNVQQVDGSLSDGPQATTVEALDREGSSTIVSPVTDKPPSPLAIAEPQCLEGIQTTLDLMMPDRPMDIQFTVFDCREIPTTQQPSELQSYTSQLRKYLETSAPDLAQPQPPMTFRHNGNTYILHNSSSVRKSWESVPTVSAVPAGDKGECPGVGDAEPLQAVAESVLDLESNEKSTVCQVICDAHADEVSWKSFLASCDQLSATGFRPQTASQEMGSDVQYLEE